MNRFLPTLFVSILWIGQFIDARLYYIHIPKTGGSTIRTLIESRIHISEIYPRRMPTREKGQKEIPLHQEVVSGHFPVWFCDQIDKDFDRAYKFTVLREPIDRYLSFLRYRKRNNPNFTSLEHVLQVISQTDDRSNLLCKFLASDRNLTGEALLQNAKENLHRFDFIIFFDFFREDLEKLCRLININLEEESLLHLNTTNPELINPELLEKIIQLNEFDIALYEYAKKNYFPKKTFYQFNSPFYTNLMTKKKNIDYTFHMPHKGSNWCYREKVNAFSLNQPIYRYIMDKPADIYFNLEQDYNYLISFTAKTVAEDIQPRVKINEFEIPIEKIDNHLFATYQGRIPRELISENLTIFTFFSSKAYQYNLIYPGNGDNRKLSFAIDTIKIEPQ